MRISDWSSDVCSSDLPWVRLDLAVLADVFLDLPGQILAQILVRHLATTEADGDLDLVALFQESKHVAQLDLVVAHVRDRTELHFLDLDLLLLLLGGLDRKSVV